MMLRNYSLLYKRIIAVLLILLLILTMSACGEQNEQKAASYKLPSEMLEYNDELVADNDSYSLIWNNDEKVVGFKDKLSGEIWSNIPYPLWSENVSSLVRSLLNIEYYTTEEGILEEASSSDCVDDGTVSVKKVDSGIEVDFYFQYAEIMIPVLFTLEQDGMCISIKADKIKESGASLLINVSLAPYLCSTPNTETKDNYLVVPSGSGALMYTDTEVQDAVRIFESPIYGTDASQMQVEYPVVEETVKLPIFAAKNGANSIFAVIEKGAEAAQIIANAGNIMNGYSNIYPKFNIRGYDRVELESSETDESVYNDYISTEAEYKIKYFSLKGADADYVGMANFYREKVLKLKSNDINDNIYNLSFLGTATAKDFVIGIPVMKNYNMTTISQAEEIIAELIKELGEAPIVDLQGFTENGLDTGAVGDGFKISEELGGIKGYKKLLKYCEKNNAQLFMDYPIINFTKKGNGFSPVNDAAKSASMQYSFKYPLLPNVQIQNEAMEKIRCLSRDRLPDAIDKLLEVTGKDIKAIGFTDLGDVVYSDYRETKYFVKGGMESQVSKLLNTVKKNGNSIYLKGANSYSAALASSIAETPISSGGYSMLDLDIPFYEMVFRTSSALYTKPLNLTTNLDERVLKSIEFGVRPAFSICAEYPLELIDNPADNLFGSLYEGQKQDIISIVSSTSELYKKIDNSPIVSHKNVDGVAETIYKNGTVVVVNYNQTPITVNGTVVQPNNFVYYSNN